MKKKKKDIVIHDYCGDQHGDSSYYVWYNDLGDAQSVSDYPSVEKQRQLQAHGYSKGVMPSSLAHFKAALLKCIDEGNSERFAKLSKRDFIFGSVREWSDNSSHAGEWSDNTYATCEVSPVLEVFFHEDIQGLHEIISALINKNDLDLFTKFLVALDNTAFAKKAFYQWTDEIKQDALTKIADLYDYGVKMGLEGDDLSAEKGQRLIAIADNLKEKVNQRITDNPVGLKGLFENLLFKLDLTKSLHEGDALLAQHRGCKQVTVNALSIAFTLGVANLVNKAVTGHGLFAVKTTSQQKVEQVEEALYPARNAPRK